MTSRFDTSLPTAERKRHGVYYTPDSVVRYLLRATAPTGAVADLSCGDGGFLVEAARAGLAVMGVDRDQRAVDLAQAQLADFPQERCHVRCGDGLAPEFPHTPDVVLGNPPYLEAKKAEKLLKDRCRTLFPTITRGGFDIYLCFLKAGLDLLPPGGRLGYIIPNKFLIADYARPLREELLRETTIEEIIDVSDLPTFRDAAVYPIMIVVRKSPPPPGHLVRTGQVHSLDQLEQGNFPRSTIPQARWEETSRRIFWLPPLDPLARGLIDRLYSDPSTHRLSEFLDIRWTVSFHRAGLRDQFVSPEPIGTNPLRLLGGMRFHGNADVRRYRTAWSGWWIDYDEARAREIRNQFPPQALFSQPKIVIAQNARRILATLDTDGYICKDTFLVGRQYGDLPLEYLLGLLNSSLLSYYYSVLFKATHVGGAYLHYLACYLEDLPIRRAEHTDEICSCVRRLLDPSLADHDRRRFDQELDEMVFDLYQLTPAERALVNEAIPFAWGDQAARRGSWDARKCAFPAQM